MKQTTKPTTKPTIYFINFIQFVTENLNMICKNGYIDDAKKIINFNIVTNYNMAIYNACSGGHIDIVKFMIEKCDSLNNWDWDLGLEAACKGGHLELAKLMIKKGAENFIEGYEMACEGGYFEIVKFIVEFITNKGVYLQNGLDSACMNGHFKIVEFMILQHWLDTRDVDWGWCLGSTCCGNHINIAKFIVYHCDSEEDLCYNRNLKEACMSGHIEMVRYMLECGATNLNSAICYTSNVDITYLLISKGAAIQDIYIMSRNFRLYVLYCKSLGHIENITTYTNFLSAYPPYVLLVASRINKNCFVKKLPVELFRLLFEY